MKIIKYIIGLYNKSIKNMTATQFAINVLLFIVVAIPGLAQTRMVIKGVVLDAQTKEPLGFATVGVARRSEEAITTSAGTFELLVPASCIDDTLTVRYLGYKPFLKIINSLASVEIINLEPSYTMLKEVRIVRTDFNGRHVDKALHQVKGNLYAMETEVTNSQYNAFLASIGDDDAEALLQYDYDLKQYNTGEKAFFRRYVNPGAFEDTTHAVHIAPHDLEDYPAVNVPHAGARAYCHWLTEQYNAQKGRKKFKQVLFRLPTLQEWQVAALGFRSFQSWTLGENTVEVTVAEDSTLSMLPKHGIRKSVPVANDILYPWFGSYYYRRSPQNHKGCFLGNFLVVEVTRQCPANLPSFDGWTMMARTASYFPNDMGLYDVVGNVAEMIQAKGSACGGSWNDPPESSTMHSVKPYAYPNATVGFRVFMEIVED
jgi:formylglycine-generating enzyme required for sulfatase activity